ncbi:MAG TPA: HD domain-containing phosphohydrolase [Candidatus Acidoferrales bacterium]
MSRRKQIWYRKSSPAAPLAESLKEIYEIEWISADSKNIFDPSAMQALRVFLLDVEKETPELLRSLHASSPHSRVIGVIETSTHGGVASSAFEGQAVFSYLATSASAKEIKKTVAVAFENIELVERARAASEGLELAERERQQLNEIGIALSSERDINALLTLILKKAREITGADAGSLYLVVEDGRERRLRFMLTQNDSVEFPFKEFTLPLAEDSMAGYTALRGEVLNFADAYQLPDGLPFHFNDRYDRDSGYRTKSLLTLPMRNAKAEVLGVLQLINSKKDSAARLLNKEAVDAQVQSFPERSVQLALSLASQAAVSYENSKLYQEIETLFEGFVQAAVTAIEQRDPTTSGHSLRVATYTQAFAETLDGVSSGPYAHTRFDAEQMKEIRYAALLHDFGKVGVREDVLVKAKKLYPAQMDVVKQRFEYIRKDLEAGMARRKLQMFLERDRGDAMVEVARLSEDFDQRLARLEEYLQFIIETNEPTLLEEGKFKKLREIARQSYIDTKGIERPYINTDEVRLLSIPKGSLDAAERLQIESHVIHTFNFLNQIPWTNELRRIPDIAKAHHEKLNGTGYPYKLHGDEIPLPTKMMTICDIFDALTASDRPYKRAVPVDRALAILESAVSNNEIDGELFRIFTEFKVYERVIVPVQK